MSVIVSSSRMLLIRCTSNGFSGAGSIGERRSMSEDTIYKERLSSYKTEALFIGLTLLFLIPSVWRIWRGNPGALTSIFLFLSLVFFFYSVNYRVLDIDLDPGSLKLKFGIFTWRIPVDTIDSWRLDDLPKLKRYGGAGIHFMRVQGRYRASFNFLEYPRIVVAFKQKVGPVRDVSFSTRHPHEVMRLIEKATSTRNPT